MGYGVKCCPSQRLPLQGYLYIGSLGRYVRYGLYVLDVLVFWSYNLLPSSTYYILHATRSVRGVGGTPTLVLLYGGDGKER